MIFNTVIAGSGGPGETVVEAKAVGIVTGAIEYDKVILIPTDIIAGGSDTLSDTSSHSPTSSGRDPVTFQTGLKLTLTDDMRLGLNYNGGNFYTIKYVWDSDYSDFTRSNTTTSESMVTCVNYRDSSQFTQRISYGGIQYVGYTVNGEYQEFYLSRQFRTPQTLDYVSGYFKSPSEYDTALYQLTPNGLVNIPAPTYYSRDPFVSKYNGNWYVVNGPKVWIAGTTTEYCAYSGFYPSGGTYVRRCQFVDDDVDYLFQYNTNQGRWEFKRIDKSSTGWGETVLNQATNALNACAAGLNPGDWSYMHWPVLICKDFGTYVEMYVYSSHFSASMQRLAHFIFDKSTEVLDRLADVFLDISGEWEVISANVNWDEGLACIDLVSSYSSGNPKTVMHCVKKLDNMAGVYKYFAVDNTKGNYMPTESITGFVKSNEGTDDLGNTVVKVKTAEDPNYIWTPPVGVLLGMDVTVNEGEP